MKAAREQPTCPHLERAESFIEDKPTKGAATLALVYVGISIAQSLLRIDRTLQRRHEER